MATLRYNKSDPQQFPLYDAEGELREHRSIVHYRDKADAMIFIERVLTSREWKALKGPTDITVIQTRHDSGIATCRPSQRKICLPGWAFNQKTILHEMAHLITTDGHGERFAGTALLLYRRFISNAFADEMTASYRKHGVVFKKLRFKYPAATS